MKTYKSLLWALIAGAMFSFSSCDSTDNDELIDIPGIEDENGNNYGVGTLESPFSVAQVTANVTSGKTGVWAKGYIVGYKLGKDPVVVGEETIPGYTDIFGKQDVYHSDYNVYLAENVEETDYKNCISIQLTAEVRSALGLQSNPSNFGKEILVKGDIEKYNGVAGIKNTSNYRLDGQGPDDSNNGGDEEPSEVEVSGDPATAAAYIFYDFEDGTSKKDIEKENWKNLFTEGSRKWQYMDYSGNKFAQATAFGSAKEVEESWLITQGLDLSKAEEKVLSFKLQYRYESQNNQFKVYILQNVDGKTVKNEITDYTKPTVSDVFVESGNIDLSSYTGVVYLAFYNREVVSDKCLTWRIDDIVMGKTATAPETSISISATGTTVYTDGELDCVIDVNVKNGEGNTDIEVTNKPSWANATIEGTKVTISGKAPSVAETAIITIKAKNNGKEITESVNIEVKDKGSVTENDGSLTFPYSVSNVIAKDPQSTSAAVEKGVWAKGYVVGYKMAEDVAGVAKKDYFGVQDAYYSDHNIYLADDPNETNYKNCISIQVTANYRAFLGLKSVPENMGKEVMIKGDILKYNSIPGIKSMSDYKIN